MGNRLVVVRYGGDWKEGKRLLKGNMKDTCGDITAQCL